MTMEIVLQLSCSIDRSIKKYEITIFSKRMLPSWTCAKSYEIIYTLFVFYLSTYAAMIKITHLVTQRHINILNLLEDGAKLKMQLSHCNDCILNYWQTCCIYNSTNLYTIDTSSVICIRTYITSGDFQFDRY